MVIGTENEDIIRTDRLSKTKSVNFERKILEGE